MFKIENIIMNYIYSFMYITSYELSTITGGAPTAMVNKNFRFSACLLISSRISRSSCVKCIFCFLSPCWCSFGNSQSKSMPSNLYSLITETRDLIKLKGKIVFVKYFQKLANVYLNLFFLVMKNKRIS